MVVLGSIGSILATTTINVAFEAIGEDLGASLETVQWAATGYLLGMASTLSAAGWLVRRFGAREFYLWTLGLFAASSLLCAAAPSIEWLIVARVLQGVIAGGTMPIGQLMLGTVAGPRRIGRVMGVAGAAMITAPTLGPTLGGLLLEQLSWHWIFLINVPPSLIALVLGLRILPRIESPAAGPFDLRGYILLAIGAPTVIYGLASAVSTGSFALSAFAPIGIGIALIAAFARHAWRARQPLLDVRLWRNRGYAAAALTAVAVSASQFGALVLLALYFQRAHGEDAFMTGLLLMPQGLGMTITLMFAGRLTDRIGGGRVAVGGLVIMLVGTIPLAFVSPSTPYWLVLLALTVRGIGSGGSTMPALTAVFTLLPAARLADAMPQINLLQRLGQAAGTALLAVILAVELRPAAPGDTAAVTGAFAHTFLWATALVALAFLPAAALAIIEGKRRTARVAAIRSKTPEPSDVTTAA